MKFKMDVASTKYRVHEAYIEVARTTTVYKVGVVYSTSQKSRDPRSNALFDSPRIAH